MKHFVVVFLICGLLLAGCSTPEPEPEPQNQKGSGEFVSEEFGFSFSYLGNWDEVRRDLPNNWAIVNGADTILFTVNDLQENDLLTLGKVRAAQDTSTDVNNPAQLKQIDDMVHLSTFNEREWYTYALEFPDKEVNTIISGTVCNNKEITMVLVSSIDLYEINAATYTALLNSFSC